MAFESFPDLIYLKTLDSDEMPHGGGFKIGGDLQLKNVVVTIYKQGDIGDDATLRLCLFHDEELTKPAGVSEWRSVSDFTSLHTNWLGRVTFAFSKPWLSRTKRYWLAIESDGYTRNAQVDFLGVMLDWPLTQATQEEEPFYSWKASFYGYRRVSQ